MDDQHRADALGCAGHPIVQTPHLDRLAHEGTRFTHAFCTSPACAPTRASLITGLYSRQAGQRSNAESLPDGSWTFGRALATAGYRTAALGKMHLLPYNMDPTGRDVYQGFADRVTTEYVYPGIPSWVGSLTPAERAAWEPVAARTTWPAGESVAGYVGESSPLPDERQPEWWVAYQGSAFSLPGPSRSFEISRTWTQPRRPGRRPSSTGMYAGTAASATVSQGARSAFWRSTA